MSQQHKVGKVATKVTTKDNCGAVTYHNTVVVSWTDKTISLNNGGYLTITTKTRMNQASNEYNLNFHVKQEKYDWYVTYNDKTYKFIGNKLNINRETGEVTYYDWL